MPINSACLYRVLIPLDHPYKISYLEYDHFPLLICALTTDGGSVGYGETRLPVGDQYNWEQEQDAWSISRDLAQSLVGLSPDDALQLAASQPHEMARSVTAIATALECLTGAASDFVGDVSLPLVATVQAESPGGIEQEVDRLVTSGYRAFKVKVGFKLRDDIERLQLIAESLPPDAYLRVDANMAYNLDEALEFARHLVGLSTPVEAFEQPLPVSNWEEMEILGTSSPIPLMLDESIRSIADIDRAASTPGVAWIKLKLLRVGAPSRLREYVARAQEHGLRVAVGNGTGSDLGCYLEARAVAGHVTEACDFNGFMKTQVSLLKIPLQRSGSSLSVSSEDAVLVDQQLLGKLAVDQWQWPR